MYQSDDLTLLNNELPLHERLAETIARAIGSGRYVSGERLPTHRHLAQQFSVSIGTVTRAIDTLSERGLVRGEIGRGTFVLGAPSGVDDVIDLTINAPPPLLSYDVLMAANAQASRQALALAHGGYVDPTGTPRQRGAVARWITETRVAVDGDELLLTNGAQQGLHLAFAALRDHSTSIATEGATFPGAIAAAANLGMSMLPVEHDLEGMVPDRLDAVLEATGCKVIYTTPVCQNPLGFETGSERRRALVKVAERHDAFIVEDDIYGHYAAKSDLTYKGLAKERTFFVTSLSKSMTPLLRLGLVAPPAEFRAALARRMRAESWGLPPFIGELAAALLENGAGGDSVARLRTEAKVRLAMTQDIFGLETVPMPAGAPHLWLPMSPIAAERLARRASERKVRITPPGSTQVGNSMIGGVRLCIMAPPQRGELERGLRVIAELMQSEEEVIV